MYVDQLDLRFHPVGAEPWKGVEQWVNQPVVEAFLPAACLRPGYALVMVYGQAVVEARWGMRSQIPHEDFLSPASGKTKQENRSLFLGGHVSGRQDQTPGGSEEGEVSGGAEVVSAASERPFPQPPE